MNKLTAAARNRLPRYSHFRHILTTLTLYLGLVAGQNVFAQTFTTLHPFDFNEGENTFGLVRISNLLYGNLEYGSAGNVGAIYSVSTNGVSYTNWYSFSAPDSSTSTNRDGSYPEAGLIANGSMLYGTATAGGSGNAGTVFAVKAGTTNLIVLHHFTSLNPVTYVNNDGATPTGPLVLADNLLYGSTTYGGLSGYGVIFQIETNGSNFRVLHNFSGGTNSANPYGTLVLAGNRLYGTTAYGGSWGYGTVFAVLTNGFGFTNLYSFSGGNDGSHPFAGLVRVGDTLYGTTFYGGSNSLGAVFALGTNGANFHVLHSFGNLSYDPGTGNYIFDDGYQPRTELTVVGGELCGTAESGGSGNSGTIFELSTNGSNFTVLHNFTATESGSFTNADGATPFGPLLLAGNTLYGTTDGGGVNGDGTVFSLTLGTSEALRLNILSAGTNVLLTWPVADSGFTLQFTTNLPPAGWSNVISSPVVVNGLNVITDRMVGKWKFYRLSR
ncbi:MAG TPA: choice-of-anchor tandem repeat GloVer-containing protein [Verrucomicrobiae bacterium]|nr:choice-of-anchor tandem repeat GloVer-containing protein [Verrucomicrobiae bacterium]